MLHNTFRRPHLRTPSMEKLYFGIALGAGITALAVYMLAAARAGGAGNALRALTLAGRAQADPALAKQVATLLGVAFDSESGSVSGAASTSPAPVAKTAAPTPHRPAADGLQLLSLLQTEARLVDFLMEEIAQADDKQVGAAVKEIHRKARKVLTEHLTLGEILSGSDGDRVTVPVGFDPAEVRVVGNVTGPPPFVGTLQHPGWKVRAVNLPAAASGANPHVLQPAEVDLG